MQILLIDNYDSFSYNLIELLRQLNIKDIVVVKNDDYEGLFVDVDAVFISPGPGLPNESGYLLEAIDFFVKKETPIFGVCLGLQAIIEYFGGSLKQLSTVYHGVRQVINIDNQSILYEGLGETMMIGRYHSWVANDIPKNIAVTSMTEDFIIMSIEHTQLPIFAVQYHPESFMTPSGKEVVLRFLTFVQEYISKPV